MINVLICSLGIHGNLPLSLQSSRDIARVLEWKAVRLYSSKAYDKVYKAPMQYCLSLVVSADSFSASLLLSTVSPHNVPPPPLLQPHGPLKAVEKKVVHLSISNNKKEMTAWETGIRLAKVITGFYPLETSSWLLHTWHISY